MKTNEAYAHLAYRRAILRHTINFLMTDAIGGSGIPPKNTIICEDVFFDDREVSPEVVLSFVEELQQEEADIRLEISKFKFRREDEQSKRPARLQKSRKGSRASKAKAKR